MSLENDPLPLQSSIFEVEDESQSKACNFEVIEYLAHLVFGDAIDGLGFNYDLVKGDDVGDVLSKCASRARHIS